MGARLLAALGAGSLILIPWALGISETVTARVLVFSLRALGFERVQRIGAVEYVVGDNTYYVEFWCTPSVLPLCGIALLWFARQRASAYLCTCLGFTALSGLLIISNDVVSMHLHRVGLGWTWAHFPGAILVYVGGLLGCLIFAEIHQRQRTRLIHRLPGLQKRCEA